LSILAISSGENSESCLTRRPFLVHNFPIRMFRLSWPLNKKNLLRENLTETYMRECAVCHTMSTYILMKIFESAPHRYDRGIRMLTLGRIDAAYDRLLAHVTYGQKVLDIGCGTGSLTAKAVQKGAVVKGIDVNAQMLEAAQERIDALDMGAEFVQMGVGELGEEESETYDIVMSCLCFSELTEDELAYTLREVERILKPGGMLLTADEVQPRNRMKRILNRMARIPLVILTYAVAQTTTHAITDLPEKIEHIGLQIESVNLNRMETFIELVAKKEEKNEL
jgi:ubiquinone/menaquinone biosynthesis C-methylase UbiE